MANKKSLMMMLMMAFLLLTSISVSAKQPTDINLEAGYVDPEDEGGDPHRSPILIPEYYEEELQDLKTISDRSATEKWTIEVYNARKGEKVLVQEVEGNNYTFDTAGWESGIYIVRVTIGDKVLSEKVVVK